MNVDNKAKRFISCRRRLSRLIFFCSLFCLISASIGKENVFKTEPYELKYPVNFGSRFIIPEDNPMTKEGVALGRMLFYEERLSANNKVSCATCHRQQLAFTDGMRFSIGVDGTQTKRNSMSLSNLLWVRNLFWDGRASNLEAQANVPLTDPHEMGQSLQTSSIKLSSMKVYAEMFEKAFGTTEINGERIVKALAQFERTLISANSQYDKYLRRETALSESELNGLKLFLTGPQPEKNIRGANCVHCHSLPKTFSDLFHNNGLDSVSIDSGREAITGAESDKGRFRVPSLRNIALTAPYMHDGRFNTLEEVLDHYSAHIQPAETLSPFIGEVSNERGALGLRLSDKEKADIVTFLHALTDNDFINNPDFADPATN